MAYFLYNFLLFIAFFLALALLPFLLLAGERFRAGLPQRLGWYGRNLRSRMAGCRPLWIHAASVGEVRAARILIHGLRGRFPHRKILLSTFTQTGNALARQLTAADEVIFLPLDFSWTVGRALAILNPALLIIIETEIWPNFLRQARDRGIPAILLSGRVSGGAFQRYFRFGWLFREAIQCFKVLGMQSEADRARVMALGADPGRVLVTGNLKHAASMLQTPGDDLDSGGPTEPSHGTGLRDGFLWVVGSSHQGEEEIVLNAFESLKKEFPELRMVLAPRHPQRFREVERLLVARGLAYQKKSRVNGGSYFDKDVMMLDTIGDLERFYAMGDIAFVGGSLVDAGGHNLLEPARFRKPVLFGPYMSNFTALAKDLMQTGGGIEVRGSEDLVREIRALIGAPERCQSMGGKAYEVAVRDGGALDASVNLVSRYIQL